jgi:hypothetical protein
MNVNVHFWFTLEMGERLNWLLSEMFSDLAPFLLLWLRFRLVLGDLPQKSDVCVTSV